MDEVLCVGWIDGVCYCIDDEYYCICFILCKLSFYWSVINIVCVVELCVEGWMMLVGEVVFVVCSEECLVCMFYE